MGDAAERAHAARIAQSKHLNGNIDVIPTELPVPNGPLCLADLGLGLGHPDRNGAGSGQMDNDVKHLSALYNSGLSHWYDGTASECGVFPFSLDVRDCLPQARAVLLELLQYFVQNDRISASGAGAGGGLGLVQETVRVLYVQLVDMLRVRVPEEFLCGINLQAGVRKRDAFSSLKDNKDNKDNKKKSDKSDNSKSTSTSTISEKSLMMPVLDSLTAYVQSRGERTKSEGENDNDNEEEEDEEKEKEEEKEEEESSALLLRVQRAMDGGGGLSRHRAELCVLNHLFNLDFYSNNSDNSDNSNSSNNKKDTITKVYGIGSRSSRPLVLHTYTSLLQEPLLCLRLSLSMLHLPVVLGSISHIMHSALIANRIAVRQRVPVREQS